jgi:hypothetical protein
VFERVRRLVHWWLVIAILCPSVAWIALNRTVWPWDQAWYGMHAVDLFDTLKADPLEWPAAMAGTTPWKPPAVVWIGHLFLPLAPVAGVDAALLLSVLACHAIALALLCRALLELCEGRLLVASAGTLVAGAAPIFIALSTQFLAEASLMLAVSWFVMIMCCAPRWDRPAIAAHLIAATSFAVLAKTTAPVYCLAPGVVALVEFFRPRPAPSPATGKSNRWRWALALLLAGAALGWYIQNFDAAVHHARLAGFSHVAEMFGQRASYARALEYWRGVVMTMLFVHLVAMLVALIVVLGTARRLVARGAPRHIDVCAAAAAAQAVMALMVFALSPNRDPRYAAPLLPLLAVIVSWAVIHVGSPWLSRAVVGVLVVQLLMVHSQVLGLWPSRPARLRADTGIIPALSVVGRDPRPAALLEAIVHRTCARGTVGGEHFVGVDLLQVSGHSLSYVAAKERLAGHAGSCRYHSFGYTPLEVTESEINARTYLYWIAFDPAHAAPGDDFMNITGPTVFRRLRRRGILKREPWDEPEGVFLFRFAKR